MKEFAAKLGKAGQSRKAGLEKPEQAEGEAGEIRPPSPLMKSVRILSNTHRQLGTPSGGS